MKPRAWACVLAHALGLALLCGASARVRAQAGEVEAADVAFNIPAGPLEDALGALARQAAITLSFDPALVRDRRAPALRGRMSVVGGLAFLLAAHRLEAVRSPGGAYSVHAAAAASPVAELSPVTVRAAAEQADGPVQGYVAQRSAAATSTDTALADIPRALTVVSREQMEDQGVQTVEQSLRYAAGVLTEVNGFDLRFPSLAVRGYAPTEFLDGLRLGASSGQTGWLIEPQGLERVELLRGPSILFYDRDAPGGGSVHMVSKRPDPGALRELAFSVGSHGRRQAHADLGGALDESGELLFRFNGLLRDSGTQTDFSRDDRSFVAPALRWTPAPGSTVTLIATATRDRATPKSTWPTYALITPNPNGRIPVNRFAGEPGVDHYDRDTASLTWLLQHRLDERWTFRQSGRHAAMDLDAVQVFGTAFRSDARTLERERLHWRERLRETTLDSQLEGRVQAGRFSHTLLVGVDAEVRADDFGSSGTPAASIDAFAPVYGAPVLLPEAVPSWSIGYRTQRSGIYLQDQVRADPWVLGLALRGDGSRRSYNAGVLYQAPGGLAPYANYATVFDPAVNRASLAQPRQAFLQPGLGRQAELGLKYAPSSDAMLTLAGFDLRKANVYSFDPLDRHLVPQPDAVRLRGLEIEARAVLARRLKLVASYARLDAAITDSPDPQRLGRQPLNTARMTAALWLDYRFGPSAQGWSVGAGVRHVGKVPASVDNSRFNPSYTAADAGLRYEHGGYGFALNATNLFDKVPVGGFGQFYGQGRMLQAKLSYRW